MTDRYLSLVNSKWGHRLAHRLGLPTPTRLERWHNGRTQPVSGALLLGGEGPLIPVLKGFIRKLSDTCYSASDDPDLPRWTPHDTPLKAIVFDATGLARFEQLDTLRQFFQPVMKNTDNSPKLVVLGRPPESCADIVQASVQRSLEGFTRSLGKEIGHGGNVQLLSVERGVEMPLEGVLRFFLSPKCAYVSGQLIRLAPCTVPVEDWDRPLTGLRALVTGSARGIGAAIAETLARDGAEIILLDVPSLRQTTETLANRLRGRAIALDICAEDAAQRLSDALPDGIDILVHNAGITRDKTLARMTDDRWNSVMTVNLQAPQRLTQALLANGKLHENGRIILLASISGIAGNRGQTNYAASKAGLIGLAQAWAPILATRGITINAVAPGFIETTMTATIPFILREAGRRMNALGQGGLPQDVAEAVAWLAQPVSGTINGQVLRVCGQSLLGA